MQNVMFLSDKLMPNIDSSAVYCSNRIMFRIGISSQYFNQSDKLDVQDIISDANIRCLFYTALSFLGNDIYAFY